LADGGPSDRPWRRRNASSPRATATVLSLAECGDAAGGDEEEDEEESAADTATGGIDLSSDSRLYGVRLPRAPGIEWGTDLSFAFVCVRAVDPSGPAALSGRVEVGDQLCEVTPVGVNDKEGGGGDSVPEPINLLGAPFDYVMDAFARLDRNVVDLDYVFFRGTRDELKSACADAGGSAVAREPETVTVTVVQNKGAPDETTVTLVAKPGVNLRQLLVDNGINVYQSLTRWTNCKGKQLCGTCIVNVTDGASQTNRKSMDEASTLRENPDSYRLSCVAFAYGDVTVETFPPVNAAQWTR